MLTLAIGDLFIPARSIDLPPKFRKLLAPQPNSTPSNSKINQVICLGNITNSDSTLQFLTNISPQFNLVRGEFDNPTILAQQSTSPNKYNTIPLCNKFVHDNLKIGYTNGYQVVPRGDPLALAAIARDLDVDVLIWGGTHKVEAYTLDGKFFINPGSATGALSFDWPDNDNEEEEQEEEQDKEEDETQKEEGDEKDSDEEKSKVEKTEEKETDPKQVLYDVTEINTNIPSFCLLDTHGSTCILYIYTHIDGEVKVDKVTYTKD
ncbi:Vacuolar protein sorting-associated protein 29 [Candida viswanathii]|uniref:Vacuolar protein sorting-associated protein 29 n=1 Tax=Candida viswanathii TaxID=5486 RepID=A0A367XQN4_9ASCO|nr:Vacuolar protein sorting-associated protein 29 [Candida viswanathii]